MTRATQDDLHHQRALHGEQVDARRAHRRRRAQPQAAAAGGREGPVDRGRPHRARAEEGRRREDGHGVPVQAHAAADQLHRQPHVPDADRSNAEVGRPERLDLHAILWHFLHFRLDVVTRRLEHELEALKKRVHILEGFEKVFDALDEILRIVRKSEGKPDAAQQIIKRFDLDAEQTDAILELKIYRLARLEILIIRKELEEKRRRMRQDQRAAQGRAGPLGRRPRRDRGDPEEVRRRAPHRRFRATQARPNTPPRTSSSRKTTSCIVSRDGWVKRQKEVKDVADDARARRGRGAGGARRQHARDGGVLQQLRRRLHGARSPTCPASTGYGEPIQRFFKLRDGERIVAALSLDPRVGGDDRAEEGRRRAAGARAGGDERRLQPALQPASRSSSRARAPAGGSRGPPEGAEVVGVAASRAARS